MTAAPSSPAAPAAPTAGQRLIALEKIVAAQADTIASLSDRVTNLEAMKTALLAALGGGKPNEATDEELDDKYGDPEVRKLPRDWTKGGVIKGMKFSRCPPEFLEMLAKYLDYFVKKNAGKVDDKNRPLNYYDERNARLARGWARRLRSGWTPPAAPPAPAFDAPGANPFDQFAAPKTGNPFERNPFERNPFEPTSAPAADDPFAQGWPSAARGPAPAPTAGSGDDDSFDFGANAAPAAPSSNEPPIDDDDDDLTDLLKPI